MMAKVYLASRYGRRLEMVDAAKVLTEQGHTITSTWIGGTHEYPTGYSGHDGEFKDSDRAVWAAEDVEDVLRADWVISFSEEPRTASRGGRHVEFGIGLAAEKRMVLIGPSEHVFHCLPQVEQYDSLAAFLTAEGMA